jgi:hypothetical protein
MTADRSPLGYAQHEAAHVVVGVAVGLRLRRATLQRHQDYGAYAEFWEGAREGMLLMFAAGVAWERRCGDLGDARFDLQEIRRMRVKGNARIRALEVGAWAILAGRAGAHARVTRALLEGDLTAREIARMVRGAHPHAHILGDPF